MFLYVRPTQNIIPQEDLVIILKWLADNAVSLKDVSLIQFKTEKNIYKSG